MKTLRLFDCLPMPAAYRRRPTNTIHTEDLSINRLTKFSSPEG